MGGIEALLLRIQLGTPNNTFLSPETYNELFTMHGTTMIFLAIMPLSAAFFNFIIPLQIGARDVAFPRLNAFSYWVFLLGGLFLNASWLFGAAPDTGWFGYANLTSKQYSPGLHVDFWMLGLQTLGVASLAAAVNFFMTVAEHARARHEAHAHADLHLDELHHPGAAAAGLPGDHGGPDSAHVRPLLRHQLLRAVGRGRSAAVAAPVLDLRASRGLHPDPAGVRHRVRNPAGLRPEAAVRLRGHGVLRAFSSPSSGSACGHTTCSPPAWARSPTPISLSPPC